MCHAKGKGHTQPMRLGATPRQGCPQGFFCPCFFMVLFFCLCIPAFKFFLVCFFFFPSLRNISFSSSIGANGVHPDTQIAFLFWDKSFSSAPAVVFPSSPWILWCTLGKLLSSAGAGSVRAAPPAQQLLCGIAASWARVPDPTRSWFCQRLAESQADQSRNTGRYYAKCSLSNKQVRKQSSSHLCQKRNTSHPYPLWTLKKKSTQTHRDEREENVEDLPHQTELLSWTARKNKRIKNKRTFKLATKTTGLWQFEPIPILVTGCCWFAISLPAEKPLLLYARWMHSAAGWAGIQHWTGRDRTF